MYRVILKPLEPNHDYRFVPMKNTANNFINIHISPVDGNLWLIISESNDGGFFFTDVTQNYRDLNIDSQQSLNDACNQVTEYFMERGYEIIDYQK